MKDIPTCALYSAKDKYGNEIQSLVPFGVNPLDIFLKEKDFDSAKPVVKISVVYSSTIRSLLKLNKIKINEN